MSAKMHGEGEKKENNESHAGIPLIPLASGV
jgi:hypothetical protein